MHPQLLNRVEFVANMAIIATSLLLCMVLVKTYFLPPVNAPATGSLPLEEKELRAGETLSLPGLEWSGKGLTLVLALSPSCEYCTTSAPFYQRLVRERRDVRVVAVTPQEVEAGRRYLERLGVPVNEIRQTPLESIGVQGTPTILLVDGKGSVTKKWIGKLTAEREAEVLNNLSASAIRN